MVPTDPTVDITQQLLPLSDGNAALQNTGVASPVELALNNDKGLSTMREPPFFPSVVPHGGGSRGKASSSRLEGRALSLDPHQAL